MPASVHRHSAAAWVSLLAAACATAPASKGTPVAEPPPPPGWAWVERPHFRVLAPGPFEDSVERRAAPAGELVVTASGGETPEGIRYAVTLMDFPGGMAAAMDRGEPGARMRWGNLLDDGVPEKARVRALALGGRPALELQVRFSAEAVGTIRELWVGDSLVMLSVSAPERGRLPSAAPFLDSFEYRSSWRAAGDAGAGFTLDVLRESRLQKSGDEEETQLFQYLAGERELCRVFVTRAPPGPSDLAESVPTLRETFTRGAQVLREETVAQHGLSAHDFDLLRESGARERIRLMVAPGRIFLVTTFLDAEGRPAADGQRCLDSLRPQPPGAGPRQEAP